MNTKITKKYIALQLPVEEVKTVFGKKTGKVKTRLFEGYEIEADNREELAEQVEAFARRAACSTDLAVVRVDGEVRYLVADAHGVHQYREDPLNPPDGLIGLHPVQGASDADLTAEVADTLYALCQQHWADTGQTPDCLPTSKMDEFEKWKAWQERYRAAIAEGRSDYEAHEIACELGHLVGA